MRLIDVDELIKSIEQGEGFSWDSHGKDDLCVRKKYIDNAPTVTPTFGMFRSMLCETCQAYATNRAIAKLADEYTRPQGEWIPVSERLPDIDGYYLVSFEDEQILVAHSSSIIKNHDFEPKMLAWQVLPEPYKKGGAE